MRSPTNEATYINKEQKTIHEWLTATSSRNAKWWCSTFHNITAMVGTGVLNLPYAMSHLGCMLLGKAWVMGVPQQVIVEVGIDIVYLTTGFSIRCVFDGCCHVLKGDSSYNSFNDSSFPKDPCGGGVVVVYSEV
ncbi:hypothetical protein KY285_015054 [Solanum tuberosum]|nr:hypothetical protein KY284_015044 [Solanum tuberosum]KAH0719023.1 hypothetical protein KY285_015054 [Solanum tuberosum]